MQRAPALGCAGQASAFVAATGYVTLAERMVQEDEDRVGPGAFQGRSAQARRALRRGLQSGVGGARNSAERVALTPPPAAGGGHSTAPGLSPREPGCRDDQRLVSAPRSGAATTVEPSPWDQLRGLALLPWTSVRTRRGSPVRRASTGKRAQFHGRVAVGSKSCLPTGPVTSADGSGGAGPCEERVRHDAVEVCAVRRLGCRPDARPDRTSCGSVFGIGRHVVLPSHGRSFRRLHSLLSMRSCDVTARRGARQLRTR
jgi:hypothetical protein